MVIADFRDVADEFPMPEQDRFTETNYILIDLDKPGPLQDQRVRCALSKAIDRQELIDLTAGGILQVANGLFSPGQEGYLEDNGFSTEPGPRRRPGAHRRVRGREPGADRRSPTAPP